MRSSLNLVAAIGLAPGAVVDLLGTLVSQPDLRDISCGIDSLGLIMAPSLLALKFFMSRVAVSSTSSSDLKGKLTAGANPPVYLGDYVEPGGIGASSSH
jgi:hypothetical protein